MLVPIHQPLIGGSPMGERERWERDELSLPLMSSSNSQSHTNAKVTSKSNPTSAKVWKEREGERRRERE